MQCIVNLVTTHLSLHSMSELMVAQ